MTGSVFYFSAKLCNFHFTPLKKKTQRFFLPNLLHLSGCASSIFLFFPSVAASLGCRLSVFLTGIVQAYIHKCAFMANIECAFVCSNLGVVLDGKLIILFGSYWTSMSYSVKVVAIISDLRSKLLDFNRDHAMPPMIKPH